MSVASPICGKSPNHAKRRKLAAILGAAGMMTLLSTMARADDPTIIAQQYYVSVGGTGLTSVDQWSFTDPITASIGDTSGTIISATTSNAHGGTISSTLVSSPGAAGPFASVAAFYYQLALVALTPDAPTTAAVPIHFSASGKASASAGQNDYAYASASFSVVQDGETLASGLASHTANFRNTLPDSFSLDGYFGFSTASLLNVYMQTHTGSTTGSSIGVAASASVDPTFTIDDPYWASLYKIVGIPSDASDVQSSVPEPASWAMFIWGFGLVGAVMRRQKILVSVS